MKNLIIFLLFLSTFIIQSYAQDTFSIVAVDSVTGEAGSAGGSCVDLYQFVKPPDFIGDLIPGIGAINTQANYDEFNQANARDRMLAGDTPEEIIAWLRQNDVEADASYRQYGIAALKNGKPMAAGFTGTNCQPYRNHYVGPNYCIQGNILLGQQILDSIKSHFLAKQGTLADKLMYALQGAKVPGADSRCLNNGTSTLFAYIKVSKKTDADGSPYLKLGVKTHSGAKIEPIDSLQKLYDYWLLFNDVNENPIQNQYSIIINSDNQTFELKSNEYRIKSIEVFNIFGQKIISDNFGSYSINLDINRLSNGIYFVIIQNEINEKFYMKFMK